MDKKDFGKTFISSLAGIIKAVNIYQFGNDTVAIIFKKFHDLLNNAINDYGSVSFAFGKGNFFINSQLLELSFQDYKTAGELEKLLTKISIAEIVFSSSIPEKELEDFFRLMIISIKDGTPFREEFEHIEVKDFYLVEISDDEMDSYNFMEYITKIYGTAVINTQTIVDKISKQEKFDIIPMKKLLQNLIDNQSNVENYLMAILNQQFFRTHLETHLVNTALWSMIIAEKLGFEKNDLLKIGIAALFHDVGKLNIPKRILFKSSKLTEEETKQLNNIKLESIKLMMKYFTNPNELISLLAIYENLQKREVDNSNLTLFARIIAISDSYDSLTTPKPYRDRLLPEQAIRVMLDDDRLDARLVNIFMHQITFYPPGSTVELNTGEIAIVYSVYHDEDRFFTPTIIPVLDSNFDFFDKKVILDLSDPLQKKKRKIVKAVDPYLYGLNPMFSFVDAEGVVLD